MPRIVVRDESGKVMLDTTANTPANAEGWARFYAQETSGPRGDATVYQNGMPDKTYHAQRPDK